MKELSKIKAKAYALLFFLVALLLLLFFVDNFAFENIPEIYEMSAVDSDENFVTFGEIEELNLGTVSVYKQIDADIQIDERDISGIKTVLTNSNYFSMYNIKMTAGKFFDESDLANSQQYVVISDMLALQIYLRVNPVGESIYIDGYSYTILGVYEDDDSFWLDINKDNYSRIFIPMQSYPQYNEMKADVISMANSDSLYTYIDRLLAVYPQYSSNYIHNNYIEKLAFSTQPMRILLFCLQIVLIILLIRGIVIFSKNIIKKVYSNSEKEYLSDITKMHKKEPILLSGFILLSTAGIIVFALSIKFPIVIPMAAIPDDNLFDINHYISKIIQYFKTENTIHMSASQYFYLISNKTLWAETMLLTYIFPIIILLSINIKKIYALDFASFVEIFGYSLLIAIVLIVFLYLAFSMIASVAAYILIMLLAFLVALLLKHFENKYFE